MEGKRYCDLCDRIVAEDQRLCKIHTASVERARMKEEKRQKRSKQLIYA